MKKMEWLSTLLCVFCGIIDWFLCGIGIFQLWLIINTVLTTGVFGIGMMFGFAASVTAIAFGSILGTKAFGCADYDFISLK